MSHFDMILWMNFLEKNSVEIDYRHKKVKFNLEDRD